MPGDSVLHAVPPEEKYKTLCWLGVLILVAVLKIQKYLPVATLGARRIVPRAWAGVPY